MNLLTSAATILQTLSSRSSVKLWLTLFIAATVAADASAQSTVNAVNRHAYSANAGWIDSRADGANGARIGEFVCSGYVYAANTGWINLGSGAPANGMRYQNNSATDFGVNHDGLGNLRGLAWGANVGWLAFTNRDASGAAYEGPKLEFLTGSLSGFVWSANSGWISLSNAVAFVQTDIIAPGADTDGDGIPDGWELSHVGNLTTVTAASNNDGDRASDREEYLADTDPLVPGDELRITSFGFSANGTNTTATWASRPTRFYHVQKRSELNPGSLWTDIGLGLILPDTGPTTSRTFSDGPAAQRFLRIEAVRPLAP
jgi:hypothetical protein